MSPHTPARHLAGRFTLFASLLSIGCNDAASKPESDSQLVTLSKLFINYRTAHGEYPQDEAAFKAFISSNGSAWLSHAGVSDIAGLFISKRDGGPFKIVYGSRTETSDSLGVIAYERHGVDGKRHVSFLDGAVRQLDEHAFSRLTLAK